MKDKHPKKSTLKILSWNIQQGGGSRVHRIVKFLSEQNADILVLSEFRNNDSGLFIRKKLLEHQFLFQFNSRQKSNENSVLIASRIPCSSRLFQKTKLGFSHDVIAVDFDVFSLYGVYLPHKKKHKLFDLLLKEIETNVPSIIAGDFNTGKNFIDQKGDSFWYTDDLKKLEESGMHDAFRHIQGDQETYSWYSHKGNGYRYDHIYIHEDLLAITSDCDYFHEARVSKLSDHSPMFIQLG